MTDLASGSKLCYLGRNAAQGHTKLDASAHY